MMIAAAFFLAFFCLLGVTAAVFNQPGTLVLFAGALTAGFWTRFQLLNVRDMWVLGALFAAGEVLDWICVALSAKKFGASKRGITGAFLGGFTGGFLGFFFFGVGILPGTLIGIFAGAFMAEYLFHGNVRQSLKSGFGSTLGTGIAWGAKIVLAVLMAGYAGIKAAGNF